MIRCPLLYLICFLKWQSILLSASDKWKSTSHQSFSHCRYAIKVSTFYPRLASMPESLRLLSGNINVLQGNHRYLPPACVIYDRNSVQQSKTRLPLQIAVYGLNRRHIGGNLYANHTGLDQLTFLESEVQILIVVAFDTRWRFQESVNGSRLIYRPTPAPLYLEVFIPSRQQQRQYNA